MCSNPDTYEFRLSLDLPQQSAVPTDTFSALREIHEYSAENGPLFHTAAEIEYLTRWGPGLLRLGAIMSFGGYCVSRPGLLRLGAVVG
mgnify:CR=1 FL=1